ncbi:MAG TPA: hydroxymethylbilane synthase [Acidimicrobiales bacterium]|nr:hydroxymethylbilane synthase [Acidimicrobiales bacterium]
MITSAAAGAVRIATRGSELARWQADHVGSLLATAHPGLSVELVPVQTTGDRRLDVPIWELGGKGVFAKEVQAAVLDGRADLAVHSGKDLPSIAVDGLVLAAVPERGDARDALVGSTLDALPSGARIGTGSVRRRAQLAHLRPDLTFGELRGNMATRLAKAADFDAIVVAAVAFERLGLDEHLTEVLDPRLLLPQVAQGALAVECREDDDATRTLLAAIEHAGSRRRVDAERGFLAELGGDCNLPAGAHAVGGANGSLRLDALIASLDGHVVLRDVADLGSGETPAELGHRLARRLRDETGAAALLP